MTISRKNLRLMGTSIDLQIEDRNSDQLILAVTERLVDYERRFSANSDTSELAQVHAKAGLEPVQISHDLFELIAFGKEHSLAPQSQLNIALGPVIQSWRIGFSDARLPDNKTIKQKLALSNPANIRLMPTSRVFLTQKGMKLDLGALAKGYIADKIMAFLKEEKVNSAMINLGGNVLVYGKNPHSSNGLWHVGIQNPRAQKRGQHLLTLPVKNLSVVTSGIYQRQLTIEGRTYHHLLNRQTGYPLDTEIASLTILSPSSLMADMWTSRLFGYDIETILTQINTQTQLEGIIIDKENRIFLSTGLKKILNTCKSND